MNASLNSLEKRIRAATGPDGEIDREIAGRFGHGGDADAISSYTASVDECIALIRHVLPHWHWHVGHGPRGILPYASLTRHDDGDGPVLVEATAPTVPLALLAALLKAMAHE